jgi:hypothetical protein
MASTLLTVALASGAAPMLASAGELIHFRLPDGREGLVDDPSKVPPGAAIERRGATVATPPASPAKRDKPPPPHGGYWSDGVEAARHLADRCRRYELPPACSEADVTRAKTWATRAAELRLAIKQAEQHVEWYQRDYDECDRSVARVCSRREVDRAQAELATREHALEILQEECNRQGCLPGWLREISDRGWE